MSTYQDAATSGITDPRPPIETFPNQFVGQMYLHRIDIGEFTSMCPKTGMPDFGDITVKYVAGDSCLELKSLKMYIYSFRNRGIFYENLINVLMDDFVAACHPVFMEVVVSMTPRGGISSKLIRRYAVSELANEIGEGLQEGL